MIRRKGKAFPSPSHKTKSRDGLLRSKGLLKNAWTNHKIPSLFGFLCCLCFGVLIIINGGVKTFLCGNDDIVFDSKVTKEDHAVEPEAERARQRIHNALHDYGGSDMKSTVGSHEVLLSFLLSGILKEEDGLLLQEGTILDCGAQFGEQGAHYAVSSPHRHVISMDPSPNNVQWMKDKYGSLSNFEIRLGGLGREVGTMKPRDNSFQMDMDTEFPVYTLDSMYFDKGLKLALAHLDLEGLELDVLLGGLKTIRAYKPVFTVELRVHETNKTTPLLDLIDSEGYDTYVIDEPCGMPPVDLRNVLCIPRDRSTAFGMSDVFNILLKMKGIQRITSGDIAKVILPCCALGEECCQGNDLNGKDCCTEQVVLEWHEKHKGSHEAPIGTLAFKEGRQEFLKQHYRLRKRNRTK